MIKSLLQKTKLQLLREAHHHNLLGVNDLVFVIHPGNKGWILEAICREISNYFPGKYSFHYSTSYLPSSKAYFFSHYSLLPLCLRKNPWITQSKLLVWYTHPKSLEDFNLTEQELIASLNKASQVICTCSGFMEVLKSQGVNSSKLTFILGGADPELFKLHQRGTGSVGFSMSYYARKSPDLVLEIVRQMPHRNFILLGKKWNEYAHFSDLLQLSNFKYVETSYSEYPSYYSLMDVFVSPAKLEGGPIPLIEAMMCNAVPVASRTGFAPDIIRHDENGFIFDVDSEPKTICSLIDKAFEVSVDIRKTVEHLSWENFSRQVQNYLY